jgi:hypothetical protein
MANQNLSPAAGLPVYVVIWGEPAWTTQALHLASAMAQNGRGRVILVCLVPVNHPAMLGDAAGYIFCSRSQQREIRAFAQTTATYGVRIETAFFPHISLIGGIAAVASYFSPLTLFMAPRRSWLPIWATMQEWRLRRAVERCGTRLETLARPDDVPGWVPTVSLDSGPLSRRR